MGKHDITTAEPMNEALERHYKERIKDLESKLRRAQADLKDADSKINQLRFHIKTDEKKIEELRSSLVEMTILATVRK